MRARSLVTKNRFGDWLQGKLAKSPRSIVGVSWPYGKNPLENYLIENGYPEADIYGTDWYLHGNCSLPFLPPSWAINFVSVVDRSGFIQITAQRAIRLLEVA